VPKTPIISRLAEVISEREVQGGLRRVLLTQAKRLQWLAKQRFVGHQTATSRRRFMRKQNSQEPVPLSHGEIDPIEIMKESLSNFLCPFEFHPRFFNAEIGRESLNSTSTLALSARPCTTWRVRG
jgi:hypothetical protein